MNNKRHLINRTRISRGAKSRTHVNKVGIKNLVWTPIYFSTNHLYNFFKLNPTILLNKESLDLLGFFSQLEVKFYEQAFLSFFSPALNSNHIVTFNLTSPSAINTITATSHSGTRFSYSSLGIARKSLGIPKTSIARNANIKEIYRPNHDTNFFITKPFYIQHHIPSIKDTNLITNIDLNGLDLGMPLI